MEDSHHKVDCKKEKSDELSTLIELRRQRKGLSMHGRTTENDDNNSLQPVEHSNIPFRESVYGSIVYIRA